MIKHIYLFKLKDKSKVDEISAKIMSLKDHIPYMAECEVGVDFKGAANSYDLCEMCVFHNKEDFLRFGNDPYHCAIREYMDEQREIGIKIDYEI